MSQVESFESPGIIARNYMNKLSSHHYARNSCYVNIRDLETRLAGVCMYDDVSAKIDICIKDNYDVSESISIWTDGSIVKEQNAIAGIGFVGLNKRGQVVVVGSVGLNAKDRGMDILDVETMGVLIGVRISDDFRVENIYCDNKSVANSIGSALKNKGYPLNIKWVKGHAGDQCNLLADGLAKHGRHRMYRECLMNNQPVSLKYTPGHANKRTGWKEVHAKGFDKPLIFREDTIVVNNNAKPEDIKNIHIWERQMPTAIKGTSCQYIIAHCDENNVPLSVRRGVVINPDKCYSRLLSTNFIMTRIPKGQPDRTLHLSGFIGDRYTRGFQGDAIDSDPRWSRAMFTQKIANAGYECVDIDRRLSSQLFTNIMNRSHTLAVGSIENQLKQAMSDLERSKDLALQFANFVQEDKKQNMSPSLT